MSNVDISAIALIARHANIRGDSVAVNYENQEITYAQLYERAGRVAAALRADGVGPGDRVAYAGLNSATFMVTYFAAIWIGAAFIPLNFRLAAPEVRAVLEDSQPEVVVAEPRHAAIVDTVLNGRGIIRRLLLVDDDPLATADVELTYAWKSYRDYPAASAISLHVPRYDDDLAALLYTSGTTGRPKGVMLTHGNLWWNWVNVDSVVDTRFGEVSFAAAPLFHIGGFNAVALRTITRGGTLIIRRAFDAAQALRDLVDFHVNSMFLVPAMLAGIQKQPGFAEADLKDLRSTIAAGAPVPPVLIEAFAEKGVLVQQAWGLTETAPFATYLEATRTRDKLGSCGVAMPYTLVKVVDPSSSELVSVPGQTGELWVTGPNVSGGYWNNPEATAASFTADGWFRTGDIGYADEEGYFFIVDRLKDMIISGGENVYPAEIENALNAHPDVVDVAVVGAPDAKWGESVCAVVAFVGQPLSLTDVREYLADKIARYKLPTKLVALDSVPRNAAGKLDKPFIRRQIADPGAVRIDHIETAPFTENLRLPRP